MEKLMIFVLCIIVALLAWGCQTLDTQQRKLDGTQIKGLINDTLAVPKNDVDLLKRTDPEAQLLRDAAAPLLTTDQLKSVKQYRKLRSDSETRRMFKHAQTVGILFMVVGIMIAAFVSDIRKWGLIAAVGGILVIIVAHTLAYYIDIWRPIVGVILFLLLGSVLIFSALWVKQRKLLSHIIDTTERVKERLDSEGQTKALDVVKEELRIHNDEHKLEITAIKNRK